LVMPDRRRRVLALTLATGLAIPENRVGGPGKLAHLVLAVDSAHGSR
jgi:hypothetical protein